jgi:hypothetical protein
VLLELGSGIFYALRANEILYCNDSIVKASFAELSLHESETDADVGEAIRERNVQ